MIMWIRLVQAQSRTNSIKHELVLLKNLVLNKELLLGVEISFILKTDMPDNLTVELNISHLRSYGQHKLQMWDLKLREIKLSG